jgi:hypothetical protein
MRDSDLDGPVSPRRVTRQLREVFREAFDQLGGAEWLVTFATANDQNARVFVSAISKLLPATVGDGKNEKVIIDIPWLTRERLAYKDSKTEEPVPEDAVILLPVESQE